MAVKLGLDAKLMLDAGGEVKNVRNLTLSLEAGEADVTTRGNKGWKATVGTLKDASVEFEMVWDTADSAFNVFRQAFLQSTAVKASVLDGTGGQGLQASWAVTSFTRNEPLEEAITVSVKMKPTYAVDPPQWVGGGAAPAGP